jgi:hypothetical protein
MADEAEKSIGCPDAGAVSLAMIAGCVAATLAQARCPSPVVFEGDLRRRIDRIGTGGNG